MRHGLLAIIAAVFVAIPSAAEPVEVFSSVCTTLCRTSTRVSAKRVRVRGTTGSLKKSALGFPSDGAFTVYRAGRKLPEAPKGCRHEEVCFQLSAEDKADRRTAYVVDRVTTGDRTAHKVQAGAGLSLYELPAHEGRIPGHQRMIWRYQASAPAKVTVRPAGAPDYRSADGILASILSPGMTDEQKAIAIFEFIVDWRYHWYPPGENSDVHDPVKLVNVYGYGFCDDSARNMVALSRLAGLDGRVWFLNGHVVSEVSWDGAFHMFDPDHEVFYRLPAGRIAGVAELAKNPQLIRKTKKDPAGFDSASMAMMYATTQDNVPYVEEYPVSQPVDPTLYPGDTVTWDMKPEGSPFSTLCEKTPPPPVYGIGTLVRSASLQFADCDDEGTLELDWPYVLLGGELRLELTKPVEVKALISSDSMEVTNSVIADGTTVRIPLDFRCRGRSFYRFRLRLSAPNLRGVLAKSELTVRFQFAPRAAARVEQADNIIEVEINPLAEGGTPTLAVEHFVDSAETCRPLRD